MFIRTLSLSIAALASLSAAAPRFAPSPPLSDCNHNGIEDSVDIAFGTSADVNQDGIPDECARARSFDARP
jgi:hypothetical protein